MAWVRSILVACAVMLSWPAFAGLSYETDETSDGLRYIVVSGEFTNIDDLDEFAAVVRAGNPSVVGFNSPGGNVFKAMELGRLIRAFRLTTLQLRSLDCSSACALAFMGGVTRIAEPGAIGVHKSSFGPEVSISAADAVSAVQQLTAEVISYMIEMGVDPALLQLSLQYERDDIRYLSRSEMERYRVATTGSQDSQPPVAMPQPSPPPAPQTMPPRPDNQPPGLAVRKPSLSIPTARSGRVLHPRGSVPLKLQPDGSSNDLATLRNGSAVSILGSRDRWYQVQYGATTGFMHHTWVHVDQFESGPFGRRHVQIKSVDSLSAVEAYVRSSSIPMSAYLASNGWFAITIEGTYERSRAKELLDLLKERGTIPDDSFTTFGTTYVRKVCCE